MTGASIVVWPPVRAFAHSAEPLHLVAIGVSALVAPEEGVECLDEAADGITAPRHAPVGAEQQASVVVGRGGGVADEWQEILDVAGHDRPLFLRHPSKELVVAEPDEIGTPGDGHDAMASGTELSGDLARVVRIQEQLHASASPRRYQRASSRSAIARARSIHSSISSP